MHKNTRFICGLLALQLIVALLVLPVSAATEGKPTISASMSTVFLKAGEPLTVQGIATGQVTEGVQIWIFAGNYLNVSTAAVNPSGTFSNAYTTTGLAPAKYYVIVQHPGADNSIQVTTKGNTGQVINKKTNATIFSFTGTGNLVDAAAVTALSNAFNADGVDDIYTKLVFTVLPANEAVPTYPGNTPAPGSVTTGTGAVPGSTTVAKSPVELVTVIAGITLALGAALYTRKQ
jgi:hypothetical protein